jgi:hypothetical protein
VEALSKRIGAPIWRRPRLQRPAHAHFPAKRGGLPNPAPLPGAGPGRIGQGSDMKDGHPLPLTFGLLNIRCASRRPVPSPRVAH